MRMLPSSGFSNRRRAAICLGPAPIPRAGRRPARAGPDWRPACGSWGGPTAPGPRPAPPRGGRPRPTPAPRRISPDTVCRHRPIRRAMRAAQVPLRQARGDHGPLTGPQAQAPTGAPRHPRVGASLSVVAIPAGPRRRTSPPCADSTAATGRAGVLIRVSCNHLPAAGIDTPPARAAPARPAPAGPGPRTPPACAGRPPGRFHPRPPSPVPRPPPEPTAAPPCATRPAPEPPRTPTSHPQSAPSPAGAPHQRPSPHEAHRSLLRTRNGATTP